MSKIATILFDADGVLIRSEMASQYFEKKYGIAHVATVGFYRGPFVDCLLGKQDMQDVLPKYLQEWGWQKSPEAFIQEWFDYENKVDAELIEYVQQLRSTGIKCYVATNQEKHRAQYMLEKMGFQDSFDGLFASAHLGSKKPDLAFFEKVLDKLGIIDKLSVLFWDDDEPNIVAAQEFGINAKLYTDFEKLRETIENEFEVSI